MIELGMIKPESNKKPVLLRDRLSDLAFMIQRKSL